MPIMSFAFRRLHLFAAVVALAACTEESAPPALKLSTKSLTFAQVVGTAEPEPQTISVTLEGDGSSRSPELTIASPTPGALPSWLSVDIVSTANSPATEIAIRVNTTPLAPGSYTASVGITSPGVSNAPQTFEVSLTVVAAPTIELSSASESFTTGVNSDPVPTRTVAVSHAGGDAIDGLIRTVTYAGGQRTGWLNAVLSATQTPATITLQPRVNTLSPGTYNATVNVVSASNQLIGAKTIAVTVVVSSPSRILPTPAGVFWNVMTGSSAPAKTVQVTNFGNVEISGLTATVRYATGQPTGWLNTAFDKTTTPAVLTVQPQTAALPSGSYSAKIELRSPDAALMREVDVIVAIDTVPKLWVINGGPLSFTRSRTQQGPGSTQGIGIQNAGVGTLAGLKAEVSYAPGQPKDWLGINTSFDLQGGSIVVQAGGATLPKGGYTGYITITVPGAAGSPFVVYVSLYVID